MKKLITLFCLLSMLLVVGATCERKSTSDKAVDKQEVKNNTEPVITTYEECVVAGNKILESQPRQCKSADGKVFTERTDVPLPTEMPPKPPELPESNPPAE